MNPKFLCLGITRLIHGAGSTSVSELLSKKILQIPFFHVGLRRRQMAKAQNYSQAIEDEQGLIRFEKEQVKKNPLIDLRLDQDVLKKVSQQSCVFGGQNLVRLCKLGKILTPNPECLFFTVLLTCEEKEAARRVLERKKQAGVFKGKISRQTISEQIKTSYQRLKTNLEIWQGLYGLDEASYFNPQAYDLFINTTDINKNQVAALILKQMIKDNKVLKLLNRKQKDRIQTFLS